MSVQAGVLSMAQFVAFKLAMRVCKCLLVNIWKRLSGKCTAFLLSPCRSSTVSESLCKAAAHVKMNFHFHHLHTPYSMQGSSVSSLPPHSLYFEALERQSFLTWQPANMFFWWKCDDILFISYVIRLNSTPYIFVIVGGVRICCRQVATIFLTVWKIENSQPSCYFRIFLFHFWHVLLRVVNIMGSRGPVCSPLAAANIPTVQNILRRNVSAAHSSVEGVVT